MKILENLSIITTNEFNSKGFSKLSENGANVYHFPMIKTESLERKVNTKDYSCLIFTSKNGVRYFFQNNNIDSNINSHINKKYKTFSMQQLLQEHLTKNNLIQHNHENTRYVRHQKDSCIDHLYSNVANKINDIKTHRNSFLDHAYITAVNHSKEQI